ncbi:MAG TPA: hypothetical protein VFN21_05030 [Acidimicrobiales bacterium]|nr:hypothetical protein [Acidimicrobiales bacterium]
MSRRRSLDETHDLLLDTGVRLLLDSGVNVTLGAISLMDVCRAAGLTTAGSAYKIWETQEDYRVALMRHLLREAVPGTEAIELLTAVLEAPDTDLPDLTELIRSVAAANATDSIANEASPVYLALWLAAQHDPVLADELYTADVELIDAYGAMYDALVTRYDHDWVPPFNGRLLAVSLSALVEGLDLRSRATPALVNEPLVRPTGPDGADEEWHLFACGVEALIHTFTRPRCAGESHERQRS